MEKEIMTPANFRWDEFVSCLGEVAGKCNTSKERPLARSILEEMGNVDIEASMEYFDKHGGYCDCEILFNVEPIRL